jgi:hypothetical protein
MIVGGTESQHTRTEGFAVPDAGKRRKKSSKSLTPPYQPPQKEIEERRLRLNAHRSRERSADAEMPLTFS